MHRLHQLHKFIFALMLCAMPAAAADLVTATVVITNNPAGNGSNIVINASTRTWTNDISGSPGTLIATTNSPANAATNLINHLTRNPVSTAHYLSQSSPTNVLIRGRVGEALTVTIGGAWAYVTYSTQTVSSPTYTVRVPRTVESAQVQTNIGSGLADYLNHSTNAVGTNAKSMSRFLSKGVTHGGGAQDVEGPVTFRNLSGTNGGTITGGRYHGATLTNTELHSVYMKPFGTEETNYSTIFFYNSQTQLVAAIRANTNGYPSLFDASTDDPFAFDGPFQTDLSTNNSEAILNMFSAVTWFPVLQPVAYANRLTNRWTSTNYWLSDGNIFAKLVTFEAGFYGNGGAWSNGLMHTTTTSNIWHRGTNAFEGVSYTPRVNGNLANGANAGVLLGTNAYVRLMGPTAAYSIAGFNSTGVPDGQYYVLQLTNPASATITISHQSGTEPSAGNRIDTGTGADATSTSNPVMLQIIRDGAASRFRLISIR